MAMLYDKLRRVQDPSLQHCLKRSVVFDVTNVVPILPDWETERLHPISKRPPYDSSFFEWTGPYEFLDGSALTFRQAALIDNIPTARTGVKVVDELIARVQAERGFEEWYWVNTFWEVHGRLHIGVAPTLCGGTKDFLQCQVFNIAVPADTVKFLQEMSAISAPCRIAGPDGQPMVESAGHSSVAFMACALLNCKNISADLTQPPPKLQHATKKRGYPPLTSYKTLVLEVPKVKASVGGDAGARQTMVRGHLVRGHFKNLQHERFVRKGWHWWPAHWRGDLEDVVGKHYQLAPSGNS